MTSQGFAGFPAGKQPLTRLPDLVFTELIPRIDNLAELKVTLHVYWLLAHKTGRRRYVGRAELAQDATLSSSLQLRGSLPSEALQEGLERAVARGTLLRVCIQNRHDYYFLNSERGRQAVADLEAGRWTINGPSAPTHIIAPRPNIFVLYEQNIGPIPPLLVEELSEAERTYPSTWIEDAFREAVHLNKRSWRYVCRILERWAAEGKDDGTLGRDHPEDARRDIPGKYADYFEY
jgi:DNA replication protein